MLVIFGLSYLFSLLIASTLHGMTIHQFGFFQSLEGLEDLQQEGTPLKAYFDEFVNNYGMRHRSFKHGALHGALAAILFAFPLIATNAVFERKSWKYIWITSGYWLISLVLMGGVICAFS